MRGTDMKAAQRSTGRNKFADKIERTCHLRQGLAWATGRCGVTIKIQDIMSNGKYGVPSSC